MRKIDFKKPNTEEWKKWRARCAKATKKAIDEVAKGQTPVITELYKGQKAFYLSVASGYFGKCAYCEQLVVSAQHGDLDHYRPKRRPSDMNWSPVRVKKNGKLVPHPGYYWLAYDWKNLLLTCQLCNQVPAGRLYGKGDRFPVLGKYAFRKGQENKEAPLLLNPCMDDPAQHMEIDETGIFTGKTNKGKTTIAMLGLNFRDLPVYRSKLFGEIEDGFAMIIARKGVMGKAWASQQIGALSADDLPFSGTRKIAVIAAGNGIMALMP